jgi:hypothetical protein
MFSSMLDSVLNGGRLPWSMTAVRFQNALLNGNAVLSARAGCFLLKVPQVLEGRLILPNITRCGVSGAYLGRLQVSILLSTAKLWLVSCRLDRFRP